MESDSNRYRKIADTLRRRILAGKSFPDGKMPDERRLAETFKVSRVTVRKALRILEDEMLLRRVQGSGTYINPASTGKIPLMIDYSGTMSEYAPKLKRKLILREMRKVSSGQAAEMNVAPEQEIVYLERVDLLEGKPVAFDKAYIIPEYGETLSGKDFEHVDFIEKWTSLKAFTIEYCTQNIEAVAADCGCCEKLEIGKALPVLKSSEHYYVRRGLLAGYFVSYYNPEYISIRTQYNWKNVSAMKKRTD